MFNVGVGYIDGAIILEMSNKDNIEEEDELWCHYSNMLSPMAYVKCEECGELKSVCECEEEKFAQ
jgi:hypothetical protein